MPALCVLPVALYFERDHHINPHVPPAGPLLSLVCGGHPALTAGRHGSGPYEQIRCA